MKINSLEVKNIQSYSHEKIDFPADSIVIYGDNGVGKSTILRSIYTGIFQSKGTNELGLNIEDMIRKGENEGSIKVNFTVNNKEYEMYWKIEKEDNMTSTKECTLSSSDVNIEGVRDVQNYIINKLGFTARTFLSASYIYQNELGKILNQSKEERQSVIDDILGLTEIDEYIENAKKSRRELKNIRDSDQSTITELKDQLDEIDKEKQKDKLNKSKNKVNTLKDNLQDKKKEIKELEKEKQEKQSKLENYEEQKEKIDKLERTLEELENKIDKKHNNINEKKDKVKKIENKIREKKKTLRNKPSKKELVNSIDKLEDKISDKQEEYNEYKNNKNIKETKLNEKENSLENLKQEIENLKERINELKNEKENKKKQLKKTRREKNELKDKIPKEVFSIVDNQDNITEDILIDIVNISREISEDYEELLRQISDKHNIDLSEFNKRKEVKNRLQKLKNIDDTINIKNIEEKKNQIEDLEERISRINIDIDNNKDKIDKNKEEISNLEGEISTLEEDISRLKTSMNNLKNEIEELEEDYNEKEKDLKDRKEEEKFIEKKNNYKDKLSILKDSLDELKERKQEKQDEIDDLDNLDEEKLNQLQEDVKNLEEEISDLIKEKDDIEDKIEEQNEIYVNAKNNISTAENIEDRINEYKEHLKEVELNISDVNKLIDIYNSIKSEQRAKSIKGIRKYSNEVFKSIYTGSTYKKIEMDKDYDIKLVDNRGEKVDPELASGGEKVIIGLAIRSAIYKLISDSQDRISPPFFLDEPTTNLDDNHVDEVRLLLNKLEEWGVEQMFIISHEEDLVESVNSSYKVIENQGDSKVKVIK